MSNAAKSLFVFGVYLILLGMILLFVPNLLLSMFGFAETTEVWIRVIGVLVTILGIYYSLAAKAELNELFRWSVPARASVIFVFTVFVVLGLAPPALLIFGVIDLAAATWTAWALKSDMARLPKLE